MTVPNAGMVEALAANIYVHSFLANTGEYEKSPHYRPENRTKVRGIVKGLTKHLSGSANTKAIDFGCGTGFMIDLIHDRFTEVHGIDIAQDMMKHVDLSPGNITLHEGVAEKTLFHDESFDFACAYSFMDHLFDYELFLREAYRVLNKGGIFYSDLNPNRDFAKAMQTVEANAPGIGDLAPIITREIQGMLHNGEYYKSQFGMDPDQLEKAEPIKSRDLGFLADEVLASARRIGFSQSAVEFDWFLGQGKMIQDESSSANIEFVNHYLKSILPISSGLFKYLRFIFVK